jgi:hypothetical protein
MIRQLLVTGGLVAALAAPAAPALAASPPGGGYSLSVAPAKIYVRPADTATVQVRVQDSGTIPLKITMQTAEVSDHVITAPPSWVTYSPGAFTLRPGETRTVTVKIAGASHERNDVAVIARAAPTGPGDVRLAGAVASRITFEPIAAPASHAAPWQSPYAWLALAVFLACAAMITYYVRRAHHEARHV